MSLNTVSGVGVKTPLNNYSSAITEMFPHPHKIRMIESSISSKQDIDVLPINAGYDNRITDKYVEFLIPKAEGSFVDLSSLALELKIRVTKEDGISVLTENDKMVFANGLLHTLFKTATVFLNGVQVENSFLYNYSSFVKQMTTLSPDKIRTLGRNSFLFRDDKGSGIEDTYTEEYFNDLNKLEKRVTESTKTNGLHLCSPLLMDLNGLDGYLLDKVDVNIRLEFSSPSFVINTHQDGSKIKIHVDLCKLWATRVFPQPEAMLALNNSLSEAGSFVEYIYNKQLVKSYVIGENQSSVTADIPWGNCIPSKLYMCIVDMESFSGSYKRNPFYFTHSDLNSLSVSVNGRSIYNFTLSLPHQFAPLYYYTLKSLGFEGEHLVNYDAFTRGRMITVLDLRAEPVKDSINAEYSGNLRIHMSFKKAATSNRVLLLFGDTQGILRINSDRQIYSDIRA